MRSILITLTIIFTLLIQSPAFSSNIAYIVGYDTSASHIEYFSDNEKADAYFYEKIKSDDSSVIFFEYFPNEDQYAIITKGKYQAIKNTVIDINNGEAVLDEIYSNDQAVFYCTDHPEDGKMTIGYKSVYTNLSDYSYTKFESISKGINEIDDSNLPYLFCSEGKEGYVFKLKDSSIPETAIAYSKYMKDVGRKHNVLLDRGFHPYKMGLMGGFLATYMKIEGGSEIQPNKTSIYRSFDEAREAIRESSRDIFSTDYYPIYMGYTYEINRGTSSKDETFKIFQE